MDRFSLAVANALVGNRPTEAALEFAYAGGEWMVEASGSRIAVAGGPFDIAVDGVKQPVQTSMLLRRGQRLRIGSAPGRVWGYLSVAGGFDVPIDFGSRATHIQSGLGGLLGRTVQPGDSVPLRYDTAPNDEERAVDFVRDSGEPYNVVLGPQQDRFTDEAIETFFSSEYEVTWQQDRMAYRLEGPILSHTQGYNIITDGVVPGCIQIPGTGQPIVLMRDAGTVGGYPKLGTVIEADLGRLAQQRPGTKVRFQAVDIVQAQMFRRSYLARLQLLALDENLVRPSHDQPPS
jgi:5-oxoprolinase (ATP-hydrolysing) subunit C